MRLDEAQRRSRSTNNFDLLRLVAAFLVLFAHSFNLLIQSEPLLRSAHVGLGYGDIGVEIFFATSGFLIARSFATDPRQFAFWVKRGLRIMPALVVSILATALILGPLVTTVPIHEYLLSPQTKSWIVGNITFQLKPFLPGVFAHNPFPLWVNGSLWTLPLEVKAYALVAILGLAPRRWLRFLLPLAGLYFGLGLIGAVRDALPFANRLVATLPNVQADHAAVLQAHAGRFDIFARPFASFTIGAAFFALARWVPLRWPVFAVLLACWIPATILGTDWIAVTTAWTIPYLVLVLAYRTYDRIHLPAFMGDYSYGIYIFAFPVQQAMIHWFKATSGWVVLLLAAPVTLALAGASWRFIEAPSLTVKARLAPSLGPAGEGAERHPALRTELDRPVPIDVTSPTLVDPTTSVGAAVLDADD